MSYVDQIAALLGLDIASLEQRTAERIIKGKHRPNMLHWKIKKVCGSWDVLQPMQVSVYFDQPATFDTFEEACQYAGAQIDEWYRAQPTYGQPALEYFGTAASSPYTLSAAPMRSLKPGER